MVYEPSGLKHSHREVKRGVDTACEEVTSL